LQKREFEHHKLASGHPNIVTFHRCFSDGHFVYVVLDFCNGGDLFSAITEKRLFHGNERLIKSVFVQLIDAVAHCHKVGVYHRDIKPENVLCLDDGNDIRLSDFGLSITSPYSIEFGCGSAHYMSPGKPLSSVSGNFAHRLHHIRVSWPSISQSRIRNEVQRHLGIGRHPYEHDHGSKPMEIRKYGRRMFCWIHER
jgi:serine/threonine protein kinase